MDINYLDKDINDEQSMIRDDTEEKDRRYREARDLDRNNNFRMIDHDDDRDRNKEPDIGTDVGGDTAEDANL